jgi:hypothetical protein
MHVKKRKFLHLWSITISTECVISNTVKPVYKGHSTVKPVYKGHSREPENVVFMSSCPLYTGQNYMHYLLMGKMRLPFIDNDLLYRGAL